MKRQQLVINNYIGIYDVISSNGHQWYQHQVVKIIVFKTRNKLCEGEFILMWS